MKSTTNKRKEQCRLQLCRYLHSFSCCCLPHLRYWYCWF